MRVHDQSFLVFSPPDGLTRVKTDYRGVIDHVPVSDDGAMVAVVPTYQEAIVTSLLVVPPGPEIVTADFGVLDLERGDSVLFTAPVAALMNRYHGLTRASALTARLRLLGDPY